MAKRLVRLILYFDVFSYPLTRDELIRYAGFKDREKEEAAEILDHLVRCGLLNYLNGYYFAGDSPSIVHRRIKNNEHARKRLKTAKRYSRIIASFPFVRGVLLSGSISKGNMSETDDIDYFIITSKGRLWLARTLIILFKKIFLLNSARNFCVNYFVDKDHLLIKEQNRFTATEIVFLIPTHNSHLHRELLLANEWVKKYYPSFHQQNGQATDKDPILKMLTEKIFERSLGDKIEAYLYRKSRRFIRKKFRHMDEDTFSSCFSVLPHELRYLPNRQQFRILKRFCWKMKTFERRMATHYTSNTYLVTAKL